MTRKNALIALSLVFSFGSHVFAQSDEDVATFYVGSDNNETIVGLGEVDVIALIDVFGVQYPIFGSGEFDGTLFAGATANGILALSGEDIVIIANPLTATADASATGVEFAGSLTGNASADVTVTASATTVAVDGGNDDDNIVAGNVITTDTAATANSASVALTLDSGLTNGADAGDALVNAGARAEADSTIVTAGAGDDQVTNNGELVGDASATATTVAVGLAVDIGVDGSADVDTGSALSNSSTTAVSGITGIDGGAGGDTINNNDLIDLSATTSATGVSVGLSIAGSVHGDAASGGALSHSETRADSDATGITGGSGDDTILDTAAIDVLADSTATAVGANYSLAVSSTGDVSGGGGISDASTQSSSSATAIDGGDGSDIITAIQSGDTGVATDSVARATGIAATFAAAGSVTGDAVGGEALSETSVDADAAATSISGGTGTDKIISIIDIDTGAQATATGVSLGYSAGVGKEGSITAGAAASDASTLATSTATGIDGGDDDDIIGGDSGTGGTITTEANSTATGVSTSFSVAGSLEGSAQAGDALSKARTDADAQATAISGGLGVDEITNASVIETNAYATSTAVSAAFSVGVTKEGEVITVTNEDAEASGSAMSDASSLAKARATGLDGGDGDDTITHRAATGSNIDSYAESTATGVAASFNIGGAAKGDSASGDALSTARTDADATATGITGGAGIDTITSDSGIKAESSATATAVSAGFSVAASKKGEVSAGSALSDASSLALTNSTGIDGGDGDDTITTRTGHDFAIETVADSTATGVAATVTIAGTADGSTTSGDALSEARTDADASATSISGGSGVDTIISDARIDAAATSTATAVAADFSVSITADGDATAGAAISDASSLARSAATGIDGGEGDDTIGSEEEGISGSITTLADATATGVSASFSIAGTAKGDASAGDALSEARTDADAVATGISGGTGSDDIRVVAGIDSDALATATTISAGISVEITKSGDSEGDVSGAASLSDASSLASARAVAIDGGSGADEISSSTEGEENLDVNAVADALGVAASITVSGQLQGDVGSGGAVSQASTTAEAYAVAIDSGDDDDEITNATDVLANSDATATGVSVGVYVGITGDGDITNENAKADGMAVSDASSNASANSTAIDGGDGDDDITNSGDLDLFANSDAVGVAVSISVAGSASGDVEGGAVSDASVVAESTAIGIDGGSGIDTIFNEGEIRLMDTKDGVSDSEADASATAVAVSLNVSGSLEGDVSGSALSDTSSTAIAAGTGIAGNTGVDSIDNVGTIVADVGADSTAVAVAVDLNVTLDGDAAGAALSDSSTNSQALATGIDGGEDGDDIDNLANLDIHSKASSTSVSVSVGITGSMQGTASGEAIAKTSATSVAESIGIAGGGGDDGVDTTGTTFGDETTDATVNANDYWIYSSAASDAYAESVTVSGTGAIGAATGSTVADASANGTAYAAGIDGGFGADTILNASQIDAITNSSAEANSTSVSIGVAVGETDLVSVADSSATAASTAVGIAGGNGGDTIDNSADIFAGRSSEFTMAEARAGSTNVSVTAAIGEASGEASANAAAVAEATAEGISGGDGDDTITNEGSIVAGTKANRGDDVDAQAIAHASSQTVNVGLTVGKAFSNASSESSATAVSDISGLAGGGGVDTIENFGTIDALSSALAKSESTTTDVSIGLGASERGANAEAASTATAISTGIDGGLDGDTITTSGEVYVVAQSEAFADGSALNLSILSIGSSEQSAVASSSSTAAAIARGVYGDAGNDTITATGTITVRSDSDVDSKSRASSVAGLSIGETNQYAQSTAETKSSSLAIGIDGGTGDDDVTQNAVIDVDAVAHAVSTGTSATNSGFNLAGVSSGESMSDARATVNATAVGVRGGEQILAEGETDDDKVTSTEAIDVSAAATGESVSSATTDVMALFGSADGSAVSDASAVVIAKGVGIEGGAGADDITTSTVIDDEQNENSGDISVAATASAEVTSTSTVDGDVTFGDASSRSASDASVDMLSEAVGVDAGSGADIVMIDSLIDVQATSDGKVTSKSTANADTTFGDASSGAMSDASAVRQARAAGIIGGEGGDTIDTSSDAEISVTAVSSGTIESTSKANADTTFGDASSSTISAASSQGIAKTTGITGGDGDDEITNLGRIAANSDLSLTVDLASVSISDTTFGDAFAGAASDSSITGRAVATGITGDGSTNTISTQGTLSVNAKSNTTVNQMTVALADSTFGDANTVATSSNSARSEVVANGIEGGVGNDTITTAGQVAVAGESTIKVAALTVSSSGPASSDASSLATADVSGVTSGDGVDTITSNADFLVAAAPKVAVSKRTFGKGGHVDGNVGITLKAEAIGIDAGAGGDTVTNDGSLLVVVGRQADSMAAIVSLEDTDVLVDANREDQPEEELVGKWLRINLGNGEVMFTIIEDFDPLTGTITTRDPLPTELVGNVNYTLFDVNDGSADIAASTVDIGGLASVNAATEGNVVATGITGGAGDDTITNNGDVAVRASNRTVAGSRTVAGNITADLSTRSNVQAIGIDGDAFGADIEGGADTLINAGSIWVDAVSSTDFSSSELSFAGQDLTAAGEAHASATGIRGGAMGDNVDSQTSLFVTSLATILAEDRAESYIGNIQQQLEFSARSHATGVSAGEGDDTISTAGIVEVAGTTQASVIGYSSSANHWFPWWGVFELRSSNIVDVRLSSATHGLQLGDGAGGDSAINDGLLRVQAFAVPIDGYVAHAESDRRLNETGASATAITTATASGITGESGATEVTNSGTMDIAAHSVSTTFAQAVEVLVADDQSAVSDISITDEYVFEDTALIDSTIDFAGKEVRFLDSDIEFERRDATITALSGTDRQFTDANASGLNDATVVGTRIRFRRASGSDPDYIGLVTAYDSSTGTFTLAEPLPTVEVDDGYTLSVRTATVTGFNASTGTFTIDEVVPDGARNEAYTLSVVSADSTLGQASYTFTDASRQNEAPDTLVDSWLTIPIPNQPDFVGLVEDFDTDTGQFTLTCVEGCDQDFRVFAGDIYELSTTRDGKSGSTAIARAYGIDIQGGAATIINTGSIDVNAMADASTQVNARYGGDTASADAVAEAIGIRTGDDDDHITNTETGSINVTATALASSNTSEQTAETIAIAIVTGAGDDTVENLGSISAVVTDGGITTEATAIDLGDGNDQLFLGADSTIVGGVALGLGDDELILTGNPFITNIDGNPLDPFGGDGIDTLSLIDGGSFASVPLEFERAIKTGTGSFALTTLPTMRYVRVEDGELVIAGDYAFAADGLYETVFYSDGHNGQLLVGGSADLAGSIDVERSGDDYIADGTRYGLINATGLVDGAFTDVILPEAMPLLNFELDQGPSSLDLVANVMPFESVAENDLQKMIANNLDTIAGSASGTFSKTIGDLQLLPIGFGRAIESFSPDIHQVANEGATSVMQQGTTILQSHLRTSRARYRDVGSSPEPIGQLAMFYNSAGYGGVSMTRAASQAAVAGTGGRQTRSQSWMLGMVSRGDYDAVSGYTAFEQDTEAFAAGYDLNVNDHMVLGLSIGSADTTLEMLDAYGEGSVDGWSASAYGTWFTSDRYLEWGLGYSEHDIETSRLLAIGTDTRQATSTHDGDAWNLFLGGGRTYWVNRWLLEPFATVRYFRFGEDAFEEVGAMDLGQSIASRNSSALFGDLGINVGQRKELQRGGTIFDWNLMFGVNHDFDIDDRRIDYAYAGQPGDVLSLNGRDGAETSALLGGTLAWYGERLGMNLEYRGRFNSDYNEQSIAALFLLEF